jgi:hypothetical protein
MKYYEKYYRHSYMNFEQFKQYYCCPFLSSADDDDNKFSLSAINMFDKCDNHYKFHNESHIDFVSTYEYIQNFLCRTNEYVNRPGPVCPFIPRSLKQQSVYFFIPTNDKISNKQELIKTVRQCRYDFLHRLQPTNGTKEKSVHKCLIILIRSSNISHSMVDHIQTVLKPEFVIQYGLMLGEFYDTSNSGAKRNENFYPLRTWVPLLVIRYMVAEDIDFLNQKHKYGVEDRLNMVKKYLELYHSGLLYHSKVNHLQLANELIDELSSSVD